MTGGIMGESSRLVYETNNCYLDMIGLSIDLTLNRYCYLGCRFSPLGRFHIPIITTGLYHK